MAAFAIAAGLHRRAHTGEGQFIDVAMLAVIWRPSALATSVVVARPRLGSVTTAAKRRAPSSSARQVKIGPEALRKVS